MDARTLDAISVVLELAKGKPLAVNEVTRRSGYTRTTTLNALRELEGEDRAKEVMLGWVHAKHIGAQKPVDEVRVERMREVFDKCDLDVVSKKEPKAERRTTDGAEVTIDDVAAWLSAKEHEGVIVKIKWRKNMYFVHAAFGPAANSTREIVTCASTLSGAMSDLIEHWGS